MFIFTCFVPKYLHFKLQYFTGTKDVPNPHPNSQNREKQKYITYYAMHNLNRTKKIPRTEGYSQRYLERFLFIKLT